MARSSVIAFALATLSTPTEMALLQFLPLFSESQLGFFWRATRDLVQEAKTTGSHPLAIAKTAVDAAIESNQLTRKMFISSERPWVVVDHVQAKSALVFDEIGVHLDFDITLKNAGKSPARNVTVEAKLYPMSPLSPDPAGEQNAFVPSTQDSKTYLSRSRMVLHH